MSVTSTATLARLIVAVSPPKPAPAMTTRGRWLLLPILASGCHAARPTLTDRFAAVSRLTGSACVGTLSAAYGEHRSDNQHANFAYHLEYQFGPVSHRSGRQVRQSGAPRYPVPARDQVSGRQLSAQALQTARLGAHAPQ